MKILIFDNSGLISKDNDFCVETNTGKFAKELKELGNDVTFFGQKIEPTQNSVHDFQVLKNGMFVLGRKRSGNKIINYLLLYLKSIPAIYNAEFVYIFYPNAFKYTAFVAYILRVKYGLYIRGMEGLDDRSSHWIYKLSSTVFTVSGKFTSYINDIVRRNISSTIRPMIPFTENDIIDSRTYYSKPKYNIMYLGRTSNDKGLIELLYATSNLRKVRSDFFLTIVGIGEYIEELRSLSDKLGINDLVTFIGGVYDVGEIKKFYTNADLFVLPSYHEGFPRTLYEAMIFGTPILTTFVGGIAEHMKNGFNCIELEVKSIDSLFDSLNLAMNDYEQMGILALNATNTVRNILSSRKLSHARALYNEVVEVRTE